MVKRTIGQVERQAPAHRPASPRSPAPPWACARVQGLFGRGRQPSFVWGVHGCADACPRKQPGLRLPIAAGSPVQEGHAPLLQDARLRLRLPARGGTRASRLAAPRCLLLLPALLPLRFRLACSRGRRSHEGRREEERKCGERANALQAGGGVTARRQAEAPPALSSSSAASAWAA